MTRAWIVALALIGCGGDRDYAVSAETYVYTVNVSQVWEPARPRLGTPRAAHSLLGEPDGFLVIGGEADHEPALDIERCELAAAECTVIGQLLHPVEQAQLFRVVDGSILISDGRSLQAFDPTTGKTHDLRGSATHAAATQNGVVLVGIEGLPERTAIYERRTQALTSIDAPPLTEMTAAFGHGSTAVVLSPTGAAVLEGWPRQWSELPPLPSNKALRAPPFGHGGPVLTEDGAAYRLDSTDRWTAIAAPAKVDRIRHLVPILGGALLIASDGTSQQYTSISDSWSPGPPAPAWNLLNAVIALDAERVISVGGADFDFVAARTHAD